MHREPSESRIRLVQISDTHFPARAGTSLRGVDADEGLGSVLRHPLLSGDPPDLVVHTGDLVQREGSSPEEGERLSVLAYSRLTKALSTLGQPVYCVPGNHDHPRIMDSLPEGEPLSRQRQLVQGSWQLIMLDSSVRGSPGGHLPKVELELLGDTLASSSEHALVCMHHSPVPISSAWLDTMTIGNADELFALLARQRHVRGIVFGHIHQEFECRRGELIIAGAPSTSLQFVPGEAEPVLDSASPGLRYFELSEDGRVSTSVHRAAARAGGGRAA